MLVNICLKSNSMFNTTLHKHRCKLLVFVQHFLFSGYSFPRRSKYLGAMRRHRQSEPLRCRSAHLKLFNLSISELLPLPTCLPWAPINQQQRCVFGYVGNKQQETTDLLKYIYYMSAHWWFKPRLSGEAASLSKWNIMQPDGIIQYVGFNLNV